MTADPVAIDPPSTARGNRQTPFLWLVGGAAILVLVVLLQRPGEIVHDTRLDLLLNPQAFLSSAKNLWFSRQDFGRVQDQRVGYFFPMGPFILLGHGLGIPPWVTERLWMGLLLGLAFWGSARLADEYGIGKPAARVLGAAAYALSPFFIARTGGISAFVQPGALLPWALLPLARGSREGSPRRAACLSAVAIAAMGGANAAGTFSVLIVPVLWLLTREPGPRRRALFFWWVGAALAAMSWWLVPLVLQARYGIDFFPVSEQANVTTLFTAPFEVLRGTADWVGHLSFFTDPSLLPAWILAHDGVIVMATGLLAAAGIAGLSTRSVPERRFLRVTLLVGVAVVGSAYGGWLGNPFAGRVIDILTSGPLRAFRNVYKFEPVVLLPLAMGIIHLLSSIRTPRRTRGTKAAAAIAAVLLVVLFVVGADPLLTGNFVGSEANAISKVPSWWVAAGEYLNHSSGRALLVPGMSQATSTWGKTEEDPLTWLTTQSWASRNAVPFGSYGATQYLDVVERTISLGGDPQLPTVLNRAGIVQVVVRNDSRWQLVQAPSPRQVNDALAASGMIRVASFGPALTTRRPENFTDLHPIEVYAVPSADRESRARVFPADTAAAVSGDSSSLSALSSWGLTDRTLTFAKDIGSGQKVPPVWIVTDGNQRRSTTFGLSRDNLGYVLGPRDVDPNAVNGAALYPGSEIQDQTVRAYGDIATVTASSYGALLAPIPSSAPPLSIDGDPSTSWTPAADKSAVGEWIEYGLFKTHRFDRLEIQLRRQEPPAPGTLTIRVSTDQGSRITRVSKTGNAQVLQTPPGPTKRIRLTIIAVTGDRRGIGIAEVGFPGLKLDPRLVVPHELTAAFARPMRALPIFVFSRLPSSATSTEPQEREPDIRRQFDVPRTGDFALQAQVSAQPSPEVLRELGTTPTMTVDASSTAGDLPRFAPRNLIDGNPFSVWIAASPDRNGPLQETVSLQWSDPRRVGEFTLTGVSGYRFPNRVRVSIGTDTREASVGEGGKVAFSPLVGNHLTITLISTDVRFVGGHSIPAFSTPLALAKIDVPAISDLMPGPVNRARPIDIGCHEGPSVTIGGSVRRFSVTATMGDLVDMNVVRAKPCDPSPMTLPAGTLDLDTQGNGSPLTIESTLLGDPAAGVGTRSSGPPKISVREWSDNARSIEVGKGAAADLMITENFNAGWRARLRGRNLQSVVLDGWEQGFVIPADHAGTIVLEYRPNRTYRLGIMIGAVLFFLVLVGAFLRHRKSDAPPIGERSWQPLWAWAVVIVLGVLIGGFAVLLVAPLVLLRRRYRNVLTIASGALLAAAAFIAGITQGGAGVLAGPYGDIVTLLTVIALVGLGVTLLPERMPRERESTVAVTERA